jgi:hypothetical protein
MFAANLAVLAPNRSHVSPFFTYIILACLTPNGFLQQPLLGQYRDLT